MIVSHFAMTFSVNGHLPIFFTLRQTLFNDCLSDAPHRKFWLEQSNFSRASSLSAPPTARIGAHSCNSLVVKPSKAPGDGQSCWRLSDPKSALTYWSAFRRCSSPTGPAYSTSLFEL